MNISTSHRSVSRGRRERTLGKVLGRLGSWLAALAAAAPAVLVAVLAGVSLAGCGNKAPAPAASPGQAPGAMAGAGEDGAAPPAASPAGGVNPGCGDAAPPDGGRFGLYINEDAIGTLDGAFDADGGYRGSAELRMAGQSVRFELEVVAAPAPGGGQGQRRWQRVIHKTPMGTVTVERQAQDQTQAKGDTAISTFEGKSVTLDLKPGTVLFENLSPLLVHGILCAYDARRGGAQTVPVLALPQTMVDATVTRQEPVQRAIQGRDVTLARHSLSLAGVDVEVWSDAASGHIHLIDIPSQHAAFVREGWEALRIAPVDDPLLSRPVFDVIEERDLRVPMRDGVALATNIYRPRTDDKVPVILIRTPYKKEISELQARYYARRGYAVAVQDVRGRFGSPGTWEPFMNEGDDGYDAIEWLAVQPFANGKVGMIGASYLGWVQWWAASRKPPHLVTIIPNVAPPDPFYNIPYEYGAFLLLGAIWWADVLESGATADLSGRGMHEIGKKRYGDILRSLPVIDLDKKVLGKENPYWRAWIAHPTLDAYWQPASFLDRLADVRIPVFHQSGWFDGDGIGSKLNYLRMAKHGHPHQKLTLGPWGHTDTAERKVGDRDFGPAAIIDLQRDYLRWFDYWLKGVDNGIVDEPLVQIFAMGSNRWLTGNTYPLETTRWDRWYLASGGHANTAGGAGRLQRKPPRGAPSDTYVYDPGDPTPHPDYYEPPEREEGSVVAQDELRQAAKDYHRKVTGERKDILVYQSEPFEQPYTFAGPLSAVLYASSTGRDTDWFVSLMEVDDKGEIFPLVQGKIRARFRRSMETPTPLVPGRVYEYEVDLWQTGITIPAGHRLRVEVASAAFPVFSRNLNTGGHNETETRYVPATQVIHHSARYPSHIRLPAIPEQQ